MTPDAAEQSVCSCVHVLAALGLADGSAASHASTEPVADVEDVGRSFADAPGAAAGTDGDERQSRARNVRRKSSIQFTDGGAGHAAAPPSPAPRRKSCLAPPPAVRAPRRRARARANADPASQSVHPPPHPAPLGVGARARDARSARRAAAARVAAARRRARRPGSLAALEHAPHERAARDARERHRGGAAREPPGPAEVVAEFRGQRRRWREGPEWARGHDDARPTPAQVAALAPRCDRTADSRCATNRGGSGATTSDPPADRSGSEASTTAASGLAAGLAPKLVGAVAATASALSRRQSGWVPSFPPLFGEGVLTTNPWADLNGDGKRSVKSPRGLVSELVRARAPLPSARARAPRRPRRFRPGLLRRATARGSSR